MIGLRMRRFKALITNVRQSWNCFTVTNGLAYHGVASEFFQFFADSLFFEQQKKTFSAGIVSFILNKDWN